VPFLVGLEVENMRGYCVEDDDGEDEVDDEFCFADIFHVFRVSGGGGGVKLSVFVRCVTSCY
jgi:hypothetical protein